MTQASSSIHGDLQRKEGTLHCVDTLEALSIAVAAEAKSL